MWVNNFSNFFQNLTKLTSENEVQHTNQIDYVLKIPTKILSSLSGSSPIFYSFLYAYNVKSILPP